MSGKIRAVLDDTLRDRLNKLFQNKLKVAGGKDSEGSSAALVNPNFIPQQATEIVWERGNSFFIVNLGQDETKNYRQIVYRNGRVLRAGICRNPRIHPACEDINLSVQQIDKNLILSAMQVVFGEAVNPEEWLPTDSTGE